jgi:micrococcal nuclease
VKLLAIVLLAAIALGVGVALVRGGGSGSGHALVARVIDGDTIVLASGDHVRLVQIDTPEKADECYGQAASALTKRLLPPGTSVRVEHDPGLDKVDRYGRQLEYVFKGDENVVREGAAGVWFFGGKRGRYADAFLSAAERARTEHRGLWGACPQATLDPLKSMSSGPAG